MTGHKNLKIVCYLKYYALKPSLAIYTPRAFLVPIQGFHIHKGTNEVCRSIAFD